MQLCSTLQVDVVITVVINVWSATCLCAKCIFQEMYSVIINVVF
jgi:hypothetical protein